jgi:hypothetical protein
VAAYERPDYRCPGNGSHPPNEGGSRDVVPKENRDYGDEHQMEVFGYATLPEQSIYELLTPLILQPFFLEIITFRLVQTPLQRGQPVIRAVLGLLRRWGMVGSHGP